jgi:protein SCO1/2
MSHKGEEVSSSDFSDKILVVFFGYTSCPDICPLTLSHLSQAFREMEEDGERIQLLLITVDPARDTPARLHQYLESFHPSFLGLTGTEEDIREVADAFGAFFARNGGGEAYTVDHTARTFVIDPSGRIPLTFPITATPREMARDLALLLQEVR